MALLTDSLRRQAYLDALGNWSFTGYIQFELTEQCYRWIRDELGNPRHTRIRGNAAQLPTPFSA